MLAMPSDVVNFLNTLHTYPIPESERGALKEVTVNKSELREKVQINRDAHHDIFVQAVKLFEVRLLEALKSRVSRVERGEKIDLYIRLPVPEDHTKDYDRILTMLDMELEDTITISQAEFAQYVMDDWAWKESFNTNSTAYLTGSVGNG